MPPRPCSPATGSAPPPVRDTAIAASVTTRHRFVPVLAAALVVAASFGPYVAPVRAATAVTPATGGGTISADTAANAPGSGYTTLTGPSIAVTHPGGVASGTITLSAPTGFAFDPASTPTVGSGTTGLAATCSAPTTSAITCTVTTASSVDGTLTFSGIAVQPTARTPLASGSISLGGTAGVTGSAALLDEVAGAAAKVAFTTPPGGGAGWLPFATQPVIEVQDAGGNRVTTSAAAVTVAIGTNPGGGTLTCTGTGTGGRTFAAASGVATVTGCQIDRAGTGYTLVASAGLTDATSLSFNISAAQNTLVFTTQPGGGSAGSAFATQPVIAVQDPGGTTDTTSSASVTLQLGQNPGGGTLTCASGLSRVAVAGVATFSGCKLDRPGNGYTITATATGLTGMTSALFNVTPGAAAKIVFSTQPGATSASLPLSPQPVVTIQDSVGNTVTTSSATVAVAIATGTGASGAVLSCTSGTSVAAVNGVATFAGCTIDKAGTGYLLTATVSGLAAASSASFAVSAAPPTQLVITTQPSSSAGAGTAFAVQPVVALRDASGQTVTTSSLAVTLSITSGTGTTGATFTCSSTLTKAAVAGVAAFTGCKIDLLGSGYTLTATASGLSDATTSAITIVPGAPAKLAFTTQPVGAAYGLPFATQPVVTIQDSGGNTVTTSSAGVTLAIASGTGTAGATLSCSGGNAKVAASGVVPFVGCSISKAGTGYRLNATSTGLTSAMSSTFDTSVGAPVRLAFVTQPGGAIVGQPLSPQPAIAIQDAAGNTVTTSALDVTVAVTSGTGTSGATVACSAPVTAVGGIAAFSGCALDKVGAGYTLTATASGLTSGTSATFTVSAGAPAKLAFAAAPTGGVVSAVFVQQPIIVVQDANGNTTTSTATITLSIGTNPGGGTLTCSSSLSKAASAGTVTFSGCKIDRVGGGYTLTAVASGLAGITSGSFDVTPGVAQKLAFTTQPAGGTYATALPGQPVVAVQDSLGNTVTTYSGTVVLSITALTGTAGATLTCSGGLSKALVTGVAAFSGCAIDKPGAGYTLTATMTNVMTAVASAFTISPGAPSQLAVTTQPAGAGAGVAFTTQPIVKILDAAGNVVTGSSAIVALAITPATGTSGAALSCTGSASATAVAGAATFSGCRIDLIGTGYTLSASSTTLTGTDSAAFDVAAGPPAKVGFSTQPAGGAVGAALTSQPVVAILDAGGNVVTGSTASVTLAITSGTGTSGAILSCTGGLTRAAVAGVVTFSGCQVSKVGTGYTVRATSGTLVVATSAAFGVVAGAPAKLAVTTQPVGATYGTAFASQPVVTIQDASGNTVTTSSLAVSLAITPGTGAAGAALSCTGGATATAVGGVATVTGCAIDMAGTGYTLTATASGLTSATTTAFAITPGLPARLAFITEPGGAAANTAFTAQPRIAIQDAAGNTVTTSTLAVTLAITTGTGAAGAILSCGTSLSKTAVAGVATFSSCKIDRPGSGYTLTATAVGLTSADSLPFDIASGPAARLVFSMQPVGAMLGTPFATQPVVTIQDANGNTVTASTAVVAIAITPLSGTTGALLSCTGGASVAAAAGVATLAGCQIDRAGIGYSLRATSGTLTAATSATFTVSSGPPTQLAFTTQPGGAAVSVAFTAQPVVSIQDAGGGTAVGSSLDVTLALSSNPGGATLTCAGGLTKTAVNGVATFSGCQVDRLGSGYALSATSSGLTDATSTAFTVSAGPAARLALATSPGTSAAYGTALSPQPVVAIQDAAGNTVATSTASATIAITPGTGVTGAKLTCTGGLSKAAVAGIATFAGCAIDKAGTGYTLTISAGALTPVVTGWIAITPGPAAKLAFTAVPPPTVAAGTAFSTQPVVAIQDAAGNVVTSSTLPVTLALVAPVGSTATLSCTGGLTRSAVAGVAAFTGCAIDRAATGYSITATVTGLTGAKTSAIALTPGAPSGLGFTVSPVGVTSGLPFSKQPVVAIQDQYGSTVTTSTLAVTLALVPGTGAGGAILTCLGGLTKVAVSGVASFTGCAIDRSSTGYRLVATATGLTSGTSASFDIALGPAKQLAFTIQPTGGPGGLAFPSQPAVTIQDAGGSTVASGAGTVVLAITAGAGTTGAVLVCAGGLTRAVVNGVATFSECTIDRAGTGFTLTATSGSLTRAISSQFDVSAPVAQITVTPVGSTIRYGQAVSLDIGFAFGGAAATVELEESLDGSDWTPVSPLTTDSTGKVSFIYLIATSRWFRVHYAGDGELLPGTSRPVRVLVRYSTILRPSNGGVTKTISRGRTIAFSASVRPTLGGSPRTSVTFEIYQRIGTTTWAFVSRRVVTTDAYGRATLRWTFSRSGIWGVRARAAGSTQNATSTWTARVVYRVL